MDFTKLNIEFANMQTIITKYNTMVNKINLKIKDNLKNINKYEVKIKNNKNKLEKDIERLYITSMKCENDFLESLIKEENSNERANEKI